MLRLLAGSLAAALLSVPAQAESPDPRALVEKMVSTVGSMDRLKELRDVEYTYTYRTPDGSEDVSLERYIFEGELSWGRYTKMRQMPEGVSVVVQGYDGTDTWVTFDGELTDDPQALRMADFLRKTNFYWFAMMQKLLDPGLYYTYEGTQEVDGVTYDKVKVTFGEDVGDVQDTYVLYLDPDTHLVDQFLFTVMDFDMKDPLLMKVKYETVEGVMLPTERIYTQSNWDGEVVGDGWTTELSEDIEFSNGFERSMFAKP